MKIAIDISQIVFEGTGVAVYTKNLVTQLLRLNKNNKHQYILFGTSLRKKNILESFITDLKKENLKFKSSLWFLPPSFTSRVWNDIHHVKIEKLIGSIDLFHSSDWTQPPTKAKKVTTIHDLIVYKFPQSSHAEIIHAHKEKLYWVKRECDAIIVDSNATKVDCQEILSLPPEKMHVVPLAAGNEVEKFTHLNESQKEADINRVRNKYNLKRPFILAVGTREPRKNLDKLISAAKQIPEVDLVIAGKYGWGDKASNSKSSQENEQSSLSESGNIKILGFVPPSDIQPLYAGAKAYVHPSLYEGFGITILEAMTLGTPVITSNVSSLPEAGGQAAFYIDPQNIEEIRTKILEVISLSDVERQKVIKKGLLQSQKFSWTKTAEQTLKIYEELA